MEPRHDRREIMPLQQKKNLMISNVLGEGGFTNLL
jgi:hypothetical protein